MSIMARRPETTFDPCPEGLHLAVCVDVVDLGLQPSQWGDKHKVQLRWQVEAEHAQARRFEVRKLYTLSLADKATLRKDLEAWRGRKFSEEELAGFDLEKLIGVNAQVQVLHNVTGDGTTFANVTTVVSVPRGAARMMPDGYVRERDRPRPAGHTGPAGKPLGVIDDANDIPF